MPREEYLMDRSRANDAPAYLRISDLKLLDTSSTRLPATVPVFASPS